MRRRAPWVLLAALLLPVACSDSSDDDGESRDTGETEATSTVPPDATDDDQAFPDVIDVQVDRTDDTYDFAVTISSPYDTAEQYADGWRIIGNDGTIYGEHELAHDHAAEQPFTRTQRGVAIPGGVDEVTVEGRDLINGYGGETLTVSLPDG